MLDKVRVLRTGTSHKKCQDYVELIENEHSIVAALSDGVGSLDYSEIAAKTTVKTLCENLSNISDIKSSYKNEEEFKKYVVSIVNNAIEVEARKNYFDLDKMDCTSVFLYISKTNKYALIGTLGDSALISINSDGSSKVYSEGGSLANGTSTVRGKNAISNLHISQVSLEKNDIAGFVLTSDGLDGEIYAKGSPYAYENCECYFNALLRDNDAEKLINKRLDEITRNSNFDDDISLAIIRLNDKNVKFSPNPTWLCSCGARNILENTLCFKCYNDFLDLYGSIDFSKMGGKHKYFKKLNADPRKEREVVGISEASNKSEYTPSKGNDVSNIESTDFIEKPKSKKDDKYLNIGIALLVAGIVIGALFTSYAYRKKISFLENKNESLNVLLNEYRNMLNDEVIKNKNGESELVEEPSVENSIAETSQIFYVEDVIPFEVTKETYETFVEESETEIKVEETSETTSETAFETAFKEIEEADEETDESVWNMSSDTSEDIEETKDEDSKQTNKNVWIEVFEEGRKTIEE